MKSFSMSRADAKGRRGWGVEGSVVLAAIAAVSLSALVSLPSPRAERTEPFVIVFPPWITGSQAADAGLAAGFAVLRHGLWPFVLIAALPTEHGAPSARPRGALMMIALDGLGGCLDARPGQVGVSP